MNIFTPCCYYCNKRIDKASEVLCLECFGELPYTLYGFSKENVVMDKFQGLTLIDRAGSFLYYHKNEMVQNILYQIKYKNNTTLAYELGRICGEKLKIDFQQNIDVIVPIPLHPKKMALRGYNQSEFFSKGLSDELEIPMDTKAMIRTIHTQTQTKLSKTERIQNVKDAFKVKDKQELQGKHILLIDDVITTGATLDSAGSTLLTSGVDRLSVFTLATAFDV